MIPGQQWTQPSSASNTLLAVRALHASRRVRSPSSQRSSSGRASGKPLCCLHAHAPRLHAPSRAPCTGCSLWKDALKPFLHSTRKRTAAPPQHAGAMYRMQRCPLLSRRRAAHRWLLPRVVAFQGVAAGQAVAEDERGQLRCPEQHGAQLLLVMPTQAPVLGEDAFLWGRPVS